MPEENELTEKELTALPAELKMMDLALTAQFRASEMTRSMAAWKNFLVTVVREKFEKESTDGRGTEVKPN
jgi:hypothetical protein